MSGIVSGFDWGCSRWFCGKSNTLRSHVCRDTALWTTLYSSVVANVCIGSPSCLDYSGKGHRCSRHVIAGSMAGLRVKSSWYEICCGCLVCYLPLATGFSLRLTTSCIVSQILHCLVGVIKESFQASNSEFSVLFLGMTLWKLLENHQDIYGKFTWKTWRDMDSVSPLLVAFVRDGSIFFALWVGLFGVETTWYPFISFC
jgi:hypothetical protein